MSVFFIYSLFINFNLMHVDGLPMNYSLNATGHKYLMNVQTSVRNNSVILIVIV